MTIPMTAPLVTIATSATARLVASGLLAAVLAAAAGTAAAEGCASGCLAGTVADEFTADAAGLSREWILQLPAVAAGSRLASVVVGDGLVVAQTSDGTVHAIQAAAFGDTPAVAGSPRPGTLLWSRRIASDGGPAVAAGIGRDLVAVPHGSGVSGLERLTGHTRWQVDLGHSPAPTAIVGDWVYAPNQGGAVTRMAVNPLRQPEPPQPTTAKRPGQAGKKAAKSALSKRRRKENLAPVKIHAGGSDRVELAPSPLADGVLWCTADGLLVSLQPAELDWRRQEFSLVNPPSGPPAVRDRSIFAATTTGDLARIELPTGLKDMQLSWHAVLRGPARSGPFLSGDTVVVSLGELGIVAHSAETGAELWHTCLTGTILAVGGGRVWVIDELGKLSGFDLADGAARERLCMGPFTLPVVNGRSERLLLASPAGTLVSLTPRGGGGSPTPADTAPDGAVSDPAAPGRGPADPVAMPRP